MKGSCPVCSAKLEDILTQCSRCQTGYHKDCWEYNKGCEIYACNNKAQIETPSYLPAVTISIADTLSAVQRPRQPLPRFYPPVDKYFEHLYPNANRMWKEMIEDSPIVSFAAAWTYYAIGRFGDAVVPAVNGIASLPGKMIGYLNQRGSGQPLTRTPTRLRIT